MRPCDAAQTRALRVEQTRRGDDGRAVVEEGHKLNRSPERAEQGLGDPARRVASRPRGSVSQARGRAEAACDFARVGERVDEFRASALAVREQARDAAAVYASARRQKVVARATRDAAQLKLALRGRIRV